MSFGPFELMHSVTTFGCVVGTWMVLREGKYGEPKNPDWGKRLLGALVFDAVVFALWIVPHAWWVSAEVWLEANTPLTDKIALGVFALLGAGLVSAVFWEAFHAPPKDPPKETG